MQPTKLLSCSVYLIIFWAMLFAPADYDLGWHLKYGQHFLQTGRLLTINTLSTEMPMFHWVSTSWGVDVITYWVFANFGFLGLSVLGAGTITLTFFFFAQASRFDFFEKAMIFPLFYFLLYPVNSNSFRGQLVSILGTAILVYILSRYSKKQSLLWMLVPIFLIWSNLHAQFVTGFAILLVWYGLRAVEMLRKRQRSKLYILTGAIIGSFLVTLIHPAGISQYTVIFSHLIDPVSQFITEYIPFPIFSAGWWYLVATGFILLLAILIMIKKRIVKNYLFWFITLGIFYPVSFLVKRYMWTMYYLTWPFFQVVIQLIKPKQKLFQYVYGNVVLLFFCGYLLITNNPLNRINNMTWDSYCQARSCPEKALQFLSRNTNEQTRLLNFYAWGAYMIWHYPQIKPAIDGRMPLWRDNNHESAFARYMALEHGRADINQTQYNLVLISPTRPLYTQLMLLTAQGTWEVIYKDQVAYIFARKK